MTKREKQKQNLKIIPLGGVDGIGKNITVLEYGKDIIVIDCGLAFPDDEMFGVDLVIPDMSYLVENSDKIKGLILTHGHEDHIGAIPYLLKRVSVPVYGTRLTLGILEGRLDEHGLIETSTLNEIKAGQTLSFGVFSVEFISVTHSIPDSVALCIETPVGRIIHTGDFKIDHTPVHGEKMDLRRFAVLGSKGVRLLMCDSTNSERPGYTPSEIRLYTSFERYFALKDRRLVVATFSSNIHRVQQIINTSAKHGRKVVLTGRSMINIVNAAIRLGYMDIPSGILTDVSELKRLPPGQVTLITTGSQGEPMSALYRMAFGEHNQVAVGKNDVVILSSSPIPGNEKMINNIINELLKRGVAVVNDAAVEVHVSGHACVEELKLMHALTQPECFIPIHGEYRHLKRHAELAKEMGMPQEKIIIPEIGRVIELGKKTFSQNGEVPAGQVLVDGYGVGDVGTTVLRDRKRLAEDGVLIVIATVDFSSGCVITGPDITSKGFVYVKESEQLMDELRRLSKKSLERCLARNIRDFEAIKLRLREDLASVIAQKTKRKPVILPVLVETSI
ncbi:MAG: ribonuclease J [Eubacteriales bacterium]